MPSARFDRAAPARQPCAAPRAVLDVEPVGGAEGGQPAALALDVRHETRSLRGGSPDRRLLGRAGSGAGEKDMGAGGWSHVASGRCWSPGGLLRGIPPVETPVRAHLWKLAPAPVAEVGPRPACPAGGVANPKPGDNRATSGESSQIAGFVGVRCSKLPPKTGSCSLARSAGLDADVSGPIHTDWR